jgi:hypothetical protein
MQSKKSSHDAPRSENAFVGYWRVYGGLTAILRSTYFWVAALISLALPNLHVAKSSDNLIWTQLTIDIIPGLLGLVVGAMALMLSFSSGRFLEAIKQNGQDNSYLRKVMASFFHFSLINVCAIIMAYISKIYENWILSGFGVFFTLYGILLTMGIVSRIWHTARIFNKVAEFNDSQDGL